MLLGVITSQIRNGNELKYELNTIWVLNDSGLPTESTIDHRLGTGPILYHNFKFKLGRLGQVQHGNLSMLKVHYWSVRTPAF